MILEPPPPVALGEDVGMCTKAGSRCRQGSCCLIDPNFYYRSLTSKLFLGGLSWETNEGEGSRHTRSWCLWWDWPML